jgi:selenocysteine lyase/cysteine desulfurase
MQDNDRLTIHNVRDHIVGVNAQVPLLDGSKRQYVYFDNAASTPALQPVYDKVNEFMTWYSSVHRGAGFKSQIATEAYELARDLVACFLGADPETNTVLFGKNTTEALNKLAHRYPLEPDDVVLCSLMEHHSNDLPWRQKARVCHIGVDDQGLFDEEDFDGLLRQHAGRVKLVAITGAQNVTGCLTPIHRLAEKAHAVGAKIVVDAAQMAPHRAINMRVDDDPGHLDFVAIAAHKMYAPYGAGALVGPRWVFDRGKPDLVGGGTVDLVTVDDVRWADAPGRDEAGSPNVVGAVALAQAMLSLQEIGMDAVADHEAELTAHALRRLREIEEVEIYGMTDPERARERLGTIPFNVRGVEHYKVSAVLSCEGGIGVRNGYFCAHPYLQRLLGISSEEAVRQQQEILAGTRVGRPGMVRASFGCYNTTAEVDWFADMLARLAAGDIQGDYEQDAASGDFWPRGYQPDYDHYFCFKPGLSIPRGERTLAWCGA